MTTMIGVWIEIGFCPECGGKKYVLKTDEKIEDSPYMDIREEHRKDCKQLPIIKNYD